MNGRFAILVFFAVSLAACGQERNAAPEGGAGVYWYDSYDEARASAQENGDIILISFEARWCPWSQLMRDSVYLHHAVIESLASIKCVAVEASSDTALQKEMGIVVYPTVVITDAYGGEMGRMIGYHSPEEFLWRLVATARSEIGLTDMYRREEVLSEDPPFLMAFGRMLLEMGMYDGALLRFDRAARVDQDVEVETIEEAEYSMAECYMLSGKHKEAGRRFRVFAEKFADSERQEQARVLAAACYRKAGYDKVARSICEDYLETFGSGDFAPFVQAMLDDLNRGVPDGS